MTCRVRPRRARIVTWTKRPSEIFSTTCAPAIVDPDEAVAILRRLPFADLGFARVDHHRALRQGLPEAVYGPGKTAEQCVAIVGELLERRRGPCCSTRVDDAAVQRRLGRSPRGDVGPGTRSCGDPPTPTPRARSSSSPPAPPTCRWPTSAPRCSSAHGDRRRLASPTSASPACTACSRTLDELSRADAVVVVAGMEGALASVVGGLTPAPVVAVPTSVGYGAGARGRHRAAGDARVVRRRRHRRRHRQRLRRGVRRVATVHGARPIAIDAHVTNVAWFHCFSGIAGDMALGRLVDAGADLDEVRELLRAAPGRRMEARGRAGPARRHRRDPGPRPHRGDDGRAHVGAHRRRWSRRPDCPTACGDAHSPPSTPSPRPRAASTGVRPSRCTSTRSAGSTRSSTSSARAPRSRCSTSTRCTPARSPAASGWCAPPTACCPTRRRRWSSCCGGRRLRRRHRRRADHADRRGAAGRARRRGWGPLPRDDDRSDRLRRRRARPRRRARTSRRWSSATLADALPVAASRSCCSR